MGMNAKEFDPAESMSNVLQSAMRRANEQLTMARQQGRMSDILFLDARLQTLQEILKSNLAIKETQKQLEEKEVKDMEEATRKLVSKALWIEDLPVRAKQGEKEQMVLDAIKELDTLIKEKKGNAVQVDPEVIKPGYLRNLISDMKKENKIPGHYRMFQMGELFGITLDVPSKR